MIFFLSVMWDFIYLFDTYIKCITYHCLSLYHCSFSHRIKHLLFLCRKKQSYVLVSNSQITRNSNYSSAVLCCYIPRATTKFLRYSKNLFVSYSLNWWIFVCHATRTINLMIACLLTMLASESLWCLQHFSPHLPTSKVIGKIWVPALTSLC